MAKRDFLRWLGLPGKEACQAPAANRVLQFPDRLGFDLAHSFARDLEDSADFFERIGVAVADAVAQLENLSLAIGQGLEHVVDPCP